jgi:peptide/nickel transport system permease protein
VGCGAAPRRAARPRVAARTPRRLSSAPCSCSAGSGGRCWRSCSPASSSSPGRGALPGDPAIALSGEGHDPAANAQIRAKYGLDQPLPVQYARWLALTLRGDPGHSIRTGLDVTQTILGRLPITLELAGLGVLVTIVLGLPTGIVSSLRRGGPWDYFANAIALFGLSVPPFWIGLVLILFLASTWHLLPASGYVPATVDPVENLRRMILPAFVLGSGFAAVVMRQARSAMIESLGSDYVRAARARGLTEWEVVGSHALRNSLVSVVTILGLEAGALISGSVVTEQIFLIPGFGKLIVDAVVTRDFPIIQGVALFSATGYVVINLLVDVLYSWLNPRIRIAPPAA